MSAQETASSILAALSTNFGLIYLSNGRNIAALLYQKWLKLLKLTKAVDKLVNTNFESLDALANFDKRRCSPIK